MEKRHTLPDGSILPLLIVAGLLVLSYGLTLAPGLTWANYGADGGDLITAAATGGVAHPGGYPTYLALARLFQWIPIGSLAFRTNLLSAAAAIAASLLLCEVVADISVRLGMERIYCKWAGLLAAVAFGWSALVWSQAVITEVYALHGMLICLILYFLMVRSYHPKGRRKWVYDCLAGLVLGLAIGNQLTSAALLLVLVMVGVLEKKNHGSQKARAWDLDGKTLWVRLLGLVIGLSVYLSLPLRARSGSPINWGNAATLQGFLWLVSGRAYQGFFLSPFLGTLQLAGRSWVETILSQMGVTGLIIGLYGLITCRSLPKAIYLVSGWLLVVFSLFFMYYRTFDSVVYLLPVNLVLAFWLGLGAGKLMQVFSRKGKRAAGVIGSLILLFLVVQAAATAPKVSAAGDLRADQFSREVLHTAPSRALIITSDDQDTFSLWYYHFALGERPDLRIVVSGLLNFEWYRETLHRTYPDLVLSEQKQTSWSQEVIHANPGRPTCFTFVLETWVIHCIDPLSNR